MERQELLDDLQRYFQVWIQSDLSFPSQNRYEEQQTWVRLTRFIQNENQCFSRACQSGHVTGSALVISKDWQKILLMHHRKLDKWLQLGGHADDDAVISRVALREACEESGLDKFAFIQFPGDSVEKPMVRPIPFDIDIHRIPANGKEPVHDHYDIRYLLRHVGEEFIQVNHEAKDLRWVDLDEASVLTNEPSMTRQFQKLTLIQQILRSGFKSDGGWQISPS